MKLKLRALAAKIKATAAPYSKAIAGALGPFVLVLAVPLAQLLQLPSQDDWKRAAGAAIAGLVAVYFAPKNAD